MKLKPLIDHFKTQAKLAEALKVSPAAVHFWVQQDALPPKRAIQVERITCGKFRAQDLIAPEVLNDDY